MNFEQFEKFENKIYQIIQDTREEMKSHYHRFVELESKLLEITKDMIYFRAEFAKGQKSEQESEI